MHNHRAHPHRRAGRPKRRGARTRRAAFDGADIVSLVDRIPNYAIFVVDPDGHVLSWNAGAAKLHGYRPDEIVGKRHSVCYTEKDIEAGKPIEDLAAAGCAGFLEDEGWRVRKDGVLFRASISLVALREATGALRAFGVVTRALSHRPPAPEPMHHDPITPGAVPERALHGVDDALAEELIRRAGMAIEHERACREAREAVRLREDFLSVAGHELKTPLTALLLQLQSVDGAFRTGAVAKDLERWGDRAKKAVGQARRLERLVNELLDVSRLTSGRLALDCEDVDLGAVALEVVDRHLDELSRCGSTVTVDQRGRPVVFGDRSRLDQVITNLLANAIKYGIGKPIGIRLSVLDRPAAGAGTAKYVRLEVRDRGIGIQPEAQSRIFGRFERAVSDRHYGGFGLGLWIVREFVEAHGGHVLFQSTPGAGSTFVVEIPAAPERPLASPPLSRGPAT